MGKGSKKPERAQQIEPVSLGELIHAQVRRAIEAAVDEELAVALGAAPYERNGGRRGYRNGSKARTLTGPTGPLALTLPRATLFAAASTQEWTSTLLPRYQRRVREVNEAVVGTYLAGGNTRRIRRALQSLLKAAPLSKSAVSRVVGTLKAELEAWRTRSLAELDVFGLYLDAIALRVRSAGKVVSVPGSAWSPFSPTARSSSWRWSSAAGSRSYPGISRNRVFLAARARAILSHPGFDWGWYESSTPRPHGHPDHRPPRRAARRRRAASGEGAARRVPGRDFGLGPASRAHVRDVPAGAP